MSSYERQFKRTNDFRALYADLKRAITRTQIQANQIQDDLASRFHRSEQNLLKPKLSENSYVDPDYDALASPIIPIEPDYNLLKLWVRNEEPEYVVSPAGTIADAPNYYHFVDYSGFDNAVKLFHANTDSRNFSWVESNLPRNGLALAFNPTVPFYGSEPAYLSIATNTNIQMDTTTGFTVSFWFKKLNDKNTYHQIASKRDDANNRWGLFLFDGTGDELVFTVFKAGTEHKRAYTGATMNVIGTWYHVVVTFNGSTNTIQMYVNAVQANTTTGSTGFTNGSTAFTIGAFDTDHLTRYCSAVIDEFQYWKGKVFSSTEVTRQYTTGTIAG